VRETLLLSIEGVAVALRFAGWVIRLLPSLMPLMPFSAGFDFRLDARALAVGAFVTIVCALAAGVLPAIGATNVSPVAVLKDATGGGRTRWRNVLVSAQIAITVLLLIGAGLVTRTLIALRSVDPGFDQRGNVLIATIASRDMTLTQEHAYYERMIEQIGAQPGVEAVAVASRIPLWESGGGAAIQAWVPGLAAADRDGLRVGFAIVTPQYFSALGTKILRGRSMTARDDDSAPLVAVVNESAARLLWPGQDPIARRFRVNGTSGRELEVVGVAQDGRYNDLTEAQRAYAFLPLYQEAKIFGSRWGAEVAVVRTSADAASQARAIRRAIAAVDSRVLVIGMTTMDDHVRSAMYGDRLVAQLITAMGALALVLAAIGLFGLVSYSVTRRTREIGVRVALGAHPRDVLRLVFARTLLIAGVGIAGGIALALACGRVFSSVLYGVSPRDPWTFGAAVMTMTAASVLAAAWPGRPPGLDPIRALALLATAGLTACATDRLRLNERHVLHQVVDLADLFTLDLVQQLDAAVELGVELLHAQRLAVGRTVRRACDRARDRLDLLPDARVLPIAHVRIRPREILVAHLRDRSERGVDSRREWAGHLVALEPILERRQLRDQTVRPLDRGVGPRREVAQRQRRLKLRLQIRGRRRDAWIHFDRHRLLQILPAGMQRDRVFAGERPRRTASAKASAAGRYVVGARGRLVAASPTSTPSAAGSARRSVILQVPRRPVDAGRPRQVADCPNRLPRLVGHRDRRVRRA
jgi:ABC-type lipoprotein release transport system permease subunit